MTADDGELAVLRDACSRSLTGHGRRGAADMLATISPDTELDRYGAGGVVAALEREVAGMLGKPAAVFMPSGTMAQQSVLRVHADERHRGTIVFHPMCHLQRHEEQAYQRLHGLTGRPAGEPDRLIALADLSAIAEPVAALLLELPQRDLGGQQPSWDDLVVQCAWAAGVGAAAHLDGARLWESAAGYGRSPGEIAALFDTVYVSLLALLLDTTQERFASAICAIAAEQGIWTWDRAAATIDPGIQRVELSVGDATCAISPAEVADIIRGVLS